MTQKILSRLCKKLERTESGCVVWAGYRDRDGYGHIYVGNKKTPVHRLVYTLVHGTIPAGMCVCHHCDNPACCEPAHLFLGTQADNVMDMVNKGRNKASNQYLKQLTNYKTSC